MGWGGLLLQVHTLYLESILKEDMPEQNLTKPPKAEEILALATGGSAPGNYLPLSAERNEAGAVGIGSVSPPAVFCRERLLEFISMYAGV